MKDIAQFNTDFGVLFDNKINQLHEEVKRIGDKNDADITDHDHIVITHVTDLINTAITLLKHY